MLSTAAEVKSGIKHGRKLSSLADAYLNLPGVKVMTTLMTEQAELTTQKQKLPKKLQA